ncbi:MAG: zinc-dependent alcohol dehydrogenase family protein [Actinobacteria bacterium]|nr:zinc-dependent alcohol dehydrogenase family protein [Actinomycetota bacterium]
MRALRIVEPSRFEIVDLPRPAPGRGELLIRVRACGVCGTDLHILRGEYLGPYPVIPGHEFAGEVEAVGLGVRRFRPGDRVAVEPNLSCQDCPACLSNRENFCERWEGVGVTRPGAMAEFVVVTEAAAFAIGELPFAVGAFVEPLSCVVHGIERAGVDSGDRVLILGAGPIGILLLAMVRLHGAAEVTVVERNRWRLEVAAAWGADIRLDGLDEARSDAYDLVIDATGAPEVMARTPDFTRPAGRILLFGVPPRDARLKLEPFVLFRKELTLLSTYTSLRNSLQVIGLLQSGRLDPTPLVTHRLPLEDFGRAASMIGQGQEQVMKVLLIP